MFVRKTTRTYKGRSYVNYLLVESVRTDKGPRQRVVCSLGDLSPRPRAQWLKLAHHVEHSLVGQGDVFPKDDPELDAIVGKVQQRRGRQARKPRRSTRRDEQVVAVCVDRVESECHREAGPVHVGYQFYKRLGLDSILASVGLNARAQVLTCAMVLNRLIAPKAEYAMPGWFRRTAVSDILGVDLEKLSEEPLYRNMDRLYPNRAKIESELVERERTLFNLDKTVMLYDLTSTYFEGEATSNPKAKRGYSRDKRPDCKQVLVALVVNRDGFPVAHEVLEGNLQDRKTLETMLDMLEERVGLEPGQTVVVDRGMAYEDNLAQIRQRKLHYIVASRQPERDQWLADFEDDEGFEEVLRQPSPRNPAQKKTPVRVKSKRLEGQTYVLCISEGRIEKDRAIRQKHEARLLCDLQKLQKRVADGRLVKPTKIAEAIGRLKERYPRVARYYRMTYDDSSRQLSYPLDEARRLKAEKLDGSYMLKSSREDLSAEDYWRVYVLLTRAEDAFRDMKSPLAERPIFHHLERRVDTHIFLCVLAYHLLVAIEKTLLDKAIHTSWATVRQTLASHQISTTVLPTADGSVLRIRKASTPEPEHLELYNLLGLPTQIMAPRKTWHPSEAPRRVVTEKNANP